MVEKIKCRVNQVFCILGALAPLFGLIFLILMMYNNIWTISNIMQFIFFSVLYLASVIDNAVDRVIDKISEKEKEK